MRAPDEATRGCRAVLTQADRLALLRLFDEQGIPESAAARIAAAAQSGVRWLPAAPETAESRLGGDALLPAGMEWPCVAGGGPLSFLAGLRLDELPGWSPLPRAGWLVFFAELRGAASDGLLAPARNEIGSQIRVLHIESPATIRAVKPHPDASVLAAQRVKPCPGPTIPNDWDALESLGLDGQLDDDDYHEIAGRLKYGVEGWSLERGAHWTLGVWSHVQHQPVDCGSVLLLDVAHDDGLGLGLGAGDIQFRIDTQDLTAGRWQAAWAEPGLG